jgi:cell division protein FtsZ
MQNHPSVYLFGVGAAGNTILRKLRNLDLPNVWFVALSADAAALEKAKADLKFQLGPNICGGMGTGADPTLGVCPSNH